MNNTPAVVATTDHLTLSDQMEFARVVTSGQQRGSILPEQYRENPANVLVAVGLGQSMGLSPAESLYRISVIKGKPAAGAELIAANVRKAGHKLRVRGDDQACTATIIRADDPDYEFTVTRDMAWAQRMGLASNDNYRKQPGTMLQWRAITAVARLACPEALYGVTYTPDEVSEGVGEAPAAPKVSTADFMPQVEQPAEEPTEGEVVPPEPMSKRTRGQLFALFNEKQIPEGQQLDGINYRLGLTGDAAYTSRGDLTEDDARAVIDYLKSLPTPADDAQQDALIEEPGA